MNRKEKYKKVVLGALSAMYEELEDLGFNTDEIEINIKLSNYEFEESVEV